MSRSCLSYFPGLLLKSVIPNHPPHTHTHTPTLPVSDEQVHIITEGGSGIIWKRMKTLLRHCVLGMPGSRS